MIAFAACGADSASTPRTEPATPAPTDPPWPAGWEGSVCFARKQAGDSLTHFSAAGDAAGAYDVDEAKKELTDAANDAKEVGDYLALANPWKPGQRFVDALAKAGAELRKAAGLSKLYLTGDGTLKQVTKQTKVASAAYKASEVEYRKLAAATGLECVF
jgi:hypothetical protein